MRSRLAQVLLIAMVSMVTSQGASAQGPPALTATISGISAWVTPDTPLKIRLKVENTGETEATDLRVSLAIFEGIRTRSHLDLSFEGSLGTSVAGDTILVDGTIEPGETKSISIDKDLGEISFFRFALEDRVHPLRITVLADEERAEPIDTQMIFFHEEFPTKLGLLLTVPLHYPVVYGPDGSLADEVTGLEAALAEDGSLTKVLEAMLTYAQVRFTLAPTGSLIDVLDDMSDGYQVQEPSGIRVVAEDDVGAQSAADALSALKRLARRSTVELLRVPYAAASITELSDERAAAQLAATQVAYQTTLDASSDIAWTMSIPPITTESGFRRLLSAGSTHSILPEELLVLPQGPLTETGVFSLGRGGSTTTVVATDAGLDERASETRGLLSRQRLLAETATIMLERPSVSRIVALQTPFRTLPDDLVVLGLLRAMDSSPWVTGVKLSDIDEFEDLEEASLIPTPPLNPDLAVPSIRSLEAARSAATAIAGFASLDPDPALLAALETRLLLAESADWWVNPANVARGLSMASEIRKIVDGELDKIKAPESQTITLTSQRAEIPITLQNQTDYSVTIIVKLDSDKLTFPGSSDCPDGTSASCVEITLEPRTQTLTVPTITQATGTFPLRVSLRTPGSGAEFASSRLIIRSTDYNRSAVSITLGAMAFLILWWVYARIRRFRKRS